MFTFHKESQIKQLGAMCQFYTQHKLTPLILVSEAFALLLSNTFTHKRNVMYRLCKPHLSVYYVQQNVKVQESLVQ